MKVKKVYQLIQKSLDHRTITYSLCEKELGEEKSYGIYVSLESEKISEEVKIEDISNDKSVVMNLITYLYENSIDTIHCKDVIEDKIDSLYF